MSDAIESDAGLPAVLFAGLGQLGSALSANLARAGYAVTGVDPAAGARAAASFPAVPALDAAPAAQIVCACVPRAADVEGIAGWCLETANPPELLVNLSTIGPRAAEAIEGRLRGRVGYAECPVTGGVLRARERRITILMGCSDAGTAGRARPLLSAMAERVVDLRSCRAASLAKLANNVAAVNNALGTIEALRFGQRAGLALDTLFSVLEQGTAASYVLSSTLRRPLLEGDFDTGFALRLALKDMRLALDETPDVDLPRTRLAIEEMERGVARGLGDRVFPVLAADGALVLQGGGAATGELGGETADV